MDRLLSYPDVCYPSGCSQPIRVCTRSAPDGDGDLADPPGRGSLSHRTSVGDSAHLAAGPPLTARYHPGRPYLVPLNFARNSVTDTSTFEIACLELQRFWAHLKTDPVKLRARFVGNPGHQ